MPPASLRDVSLLRSVLLVIGVALGVGLVWFGTELALVARTDPSLHWMELLRRALALLPWQLVLFALLGVALVPVVRGLAATPMDLGWWTLGAASFALLAARVGEGVLRQGTAARAAVVIGCIGLGLAGGLVLLRGLGRLLPDPLRRAWPLAAWSGWTLLFLSYLLRAGPALANGRTGPTGWLAYFEPGEVLLSIAVAGGVLIAASGLRRLLLAMVGAGALAWPGGPIARARVAPAPERRPDVIVILVDTYRFDHLGVQVERPGLTPHLDALAEQSIRFSRAFSPSNATRLAMPGIMTALPSMVTGSPLPEEVDCLAELLKRAGYATYGISTNPNVSAQFGYQQGFDLFLDPTGQPDFLIVSVLQILGATLPGPAYGAGLVTAGLYYRPFEEVRRRGVWFLERSPGPTFLYLHTMDPHGPYLPPREHLPPEFALADFYPYYDFNELSGRGVLNSPAFARHLRNLKQRYEGEVRYSDAELGRLVEQLRALGRWDESLVWVLSDHGEAFGEHDFAGHGGENLTRTLIQVPLLLKLPRSWGIEPRVETTPVSTMDLVPTTLSLLGEPPPSLEFGRDQAPLIREGASGEPRTVVSHTTMYDPELDSVVDLYSAVAWPWKLDVRFRRLGSALGRRLFHLERDPREEVDLAAREPRTAARLEEDVDAWRDLELRHVFGEGVAPIDPRVLEQLRKLGYVE